MPRTRDRRPMPRTRDRRLAATPTADRGFRLDPRNARRRQPSHSLCTEGMFSQPALGGVSASAASAPQWRHTLPGPAGHWPPRRACRTRRPQLRLTPRLRRDPLRLRGEGVTFRVLRLPLGLACGFPKHPVGTPASQQQRPCVPLLLRAVGEGGPGRMRRCLPATVRWRVAAHRRSPSSYPQLQGSIRSC